MTTPGPRHDPAHTPPSYPPRRHPAAINDVRTHAAERPPQQPPQQPPQPPPLRSASRPRPKPQSIEEAKLNLRVTAARKDHPRSSVDRHGPSMLGGHSNTIAGEVAQASFRFAKDHPAAIATGVGLVALALGPGAIFKGVTTAARLATVAGLLGKAVK